MFIIVRINNGFRFSSKHFKAGPKISLSTISIVTLQFCFKKVLTCFCINLTSLWLDNNFSSLDYLAKICVMMVCFRTQTEHLFLLRVHCSWNNKKVNVSCIIFLIWPRYYCNGPHTTCVQTSIFFIWDPFPHFPNIWFSDVLHSKRVPFRKFFLLFFHIVLLYVISNSLPTFQCAYKTQVLKTLSV